MVSKWGNPQGGFLLGFFSSKLNKGTLNKDTPQVHQTHTGKVLENPRSLLAIVVLPEAWPIACLT